MNVLEARCHHAYQRSCYTSLAWASPTEQVHALAREVIDRARAVTKMDSSGPRRLVCSLKEAYRHLPHRALCVFVASDIVQSPVSPYDVLKMRNTIVQTAAAHNIPCIATMTKKEIGSVFGQGASVCCAAVVCVDGLEWEFQMLLDALDALRRIDQYR